MAEENNETVEVITEKDEETLGNLREKSGMDLSYLKLSDRITTHKEIIIKQSGMDRELAGRNLTVNNNGDLRYTFPRPNYTHMAKLTQYNRDNSVKNQIKKEIFKEEE